MFGWRREGEKINERKEVEWNTELLGLRAKMSRKFVIDVIK